MTSRLSEEHLSRAYDAGYQNFSQVLHEHPAFPIAKLDLNALLLQPNPRKLVHALPAQTLYIALMERGLEDCLEILPLLSKEQFIQICDYDVWHDDQLVPQKLFKWLNCYKEISPKELCRRFQSLDEEYQLAALNTRIRIFDSEEYEQMSDDQQDNLYALPNNALYYEIFTDDAKLHQDIQDLIDAFLGEHMGYVMHLLSQAAYLPPHESEQALAQFRKARIEEDGFLAREDSVAYFLPLDHHALRKKWAGGQDVHDDFSSHEASLEIKVKNQDFLQATLERLKERMPSEKLMYLQAGFIKLANALCSASHIEPGDIRDLKEILHQATGLASLGLEYLSGKDLNRAALILEQEYPKVLFQTGISLIREEQKKFITFLKEHSIEQCDVLCKNWVTFKYGAVLCWFDRHMEIFGHENTEILKGLFNRFPLLPWTIEQTHDNVSRIYFKPVNNLYDFQLFQERIRVIYEELAKRA